MIEIKGVTKYFDTHKVLDKLDLTINTGETMVVIGRSGGGKSVLLKHIIGLLKPDGGQVLIDGADVGTMAGRPLNELRKKFGMLFQGAALFDSMTVGDNVAFPLREHTRMDPAAIGERVR